MSRSSKHAIALHAVKSATTALRIKARMLQPTIRRELTKAVHVKLADKTERELAKALEPLFVRQLHAILAGLEGGGSKEEFATIEKSDSSEAKQVHRIIARIFDPADWHDELVDRALPVLAVGMARSVVGQFMAMGVDVRKRRKEVPDLQQKKRDDEGAGRTTASRWLADNPEDLAYLDELVEAAGVEGFGILTELPLRMKQRIAHALTDTFSQDYWDNISETTGGDAEAILRRGLREGESISQMAGRLRESLIEGGEDKYYARVRGYNIARTEANYALNSARAGEMNSLIRDVPELAIKRSWLSVLGPTTRPEHADLDGVPEDENGEWDLAGYKIKVPGDPVLPPEQRCSCQCTAQYEWGMDESEAKPLIEDYYRRQQEALEEDEEASVGGLREKHLPGQHDQSTHGSGGGGEGEAKEPPSREFRSPPKPHGKPGGTAGGFSATGQTNTEVGDMAELALQQLGLKSLLPPGKRQNPLDAEWDDSGWAFEIKAVTTSATEYKAKPKAHEVKEKLAYAKKHGKKPAMMIAVVDTKAKEIHAYWRPGIGAYRLGNEQGDWRYMGSVSLKGKRR